VVADASVVLAMYLSLFILNIYVLLSVLMFFVQEMYPVVLSKRELYQCKKEIVCDELLIRTEAKAGQMYIG